jgi:hypothetical protein
MICSRSRLDYSKRFIDCSLNKQYKNSMKKYSGIYKGAEEFHNGETWFVAESCIVVDVGAAECEAAGMASFLVILKDIDGIERRFVCGHKYMGERKIETAEDLEIVKRVHRQIIDIKATDEDLDELYCDVKSVQASSFVPIIDAIADEVLSLDVLSDD